MGDRDTGEVRAFTRPTVRLVALAAALTVAACGRTAPPESAEDPTTAPPAPAPTVVAVTTTVATPTYVVQSGDTLSAIAERFGVTQQALADFNAIGDVHDITVGQQLRIPPVETQVAGTVQTNDAPSDPSE